MKWSRHFIYSNCNKEFIFKDKIIFDKLLISKTTNLLDLSEITIDGKIQYSEYTNIIKILLNIQGAMDVPCSITLEPIKYPFSDNEEYFFAFEKVDSEEEINYLKGDILDITSYVWQLIVMNIPLRIVKPGVELKPINNEDWAVLSEDEYKKIKKCDPRLESLKNYFDNKE